MRRDLRNPAKGSGSEVVLGRSDNGPYTRRPGRLLVNIVQVKDLDDLESDFLQFPYKITYPTSLHTG